MVLLSSALDGQMLLAPLTRGGTPPYRRLCADFGCEVAMGEMVFARHLINGDRLERTRLRRAPNEQLFAVQIATNGVDEGLSAVKMAHEAGADWVDLNCGCPIYEATRRNLGSALLRFPDKLATLVGGIAAESPLPLSVKIRIAAEGGEVNVREVVTKLRDAGAAAVTIHGRSATDRYAKAADWNLISQCVADNRRAGSSMPIIGNGDVLTHYEATQRIRDSGVNGVMVGRGALMKPWLFQEFKDGRSWDPTAVERVEVYRRLTAYMKEHFGDDDRGRKKAWYFLPWHFDFLTRYRPLPEETYAQLALETPLMQTRFDQIDEEASPLERILAHTDKAAHEMIAACLWEATSDSDAAHKLEALADSAELKALGQVEDSAEVSELANIPQGGEDKSSGGAKRGRSRRRREPKPQRTEAEIAELRKVRAAKRLATGAPPHVSGKRRGS